MSAATYIRAERFAPPERPSGTVSADAHRLWLTTWKLVQVHMLPGFPLWEEAVYNMLRSQFEPLSSIFKAYSAASLQGSGDGMELDEFYDFVVETNLITDQYGFDTMSGQFTKANAGSDDNHLELHEFLTMLVRIAFFRANPQHGMRIGKDQKNADKFGEEVPLPGCLNTLLCEYILPLARRDTYAAEFRREVLPLPEVQQALGAESGRLTTLYELVSEGRECLQLAQWVKLLESRLLLSDLSVHSYAVRLTEPQARWAFLLSAKDPTAGLTPEELSGCVARTACDKYRAVTPMSPGARVRAFLGNLLDKTDEEDALLAYIEPQAPSSRAVRPPSPARTHSLSLPPPGHLAAAVPAAPAVTAPVASTVDRV